MYAIRSYYVRNNYWFESTEENSPGKFLIEWFSFHPAGYVITSYSIHYTKLYETAFDVSVGSVTNTAYANVTPNGGDPVRTNMDWVTVFSDKPDLIVTKTNDVGGYAMDNHTFTWTLTVLSYNFV